MKSMDFHRFFQCSNGTKTSKSSAFAVLGAAAAVAEPAEAVATAAAWVAKRAACWATFKLGLAEKWCPFLAEKTFLVWTKRFSLVADFMFFFETSGFYVFFEWSEKWKLGPPVLQLWRPSVWPKNGCTSSFASKIKRIQIFDLTPTWFLIFDFWNMLKHLEPCSLKPSWKEACWSSKKTSCFNTGAKQLYLLVLWPLANFSQRPHLAFAKNPRCSSAVDMQRGHPPFSCPFCWEVQGFKGWEYMNI